MPKHFDYVMVAYGLWVVTFVLYLFYLHRKSRAARQALARMQGGPESR